MKIADLDHPVTAKAASAAGVSHSDFERLATFLDVECLSIKKLQSSGLLALVKFPRLRALFINWAPKLETFTGLENAKHLRLLSLVQFPKITDITPICELRDLPALELFGGHSKPQVIHSLDGLGDMPSLQELTLVNLKVIEDGLRPLARSVSLRDLRVSHQFDTEDYAYLAAKMPHLRCDLSVPFVSIGNCGSGKDVKVTGRRKPFLNSKTDADKLARYVQKFEKLVADFKQD
ncbi:hypothetical protein FEE96_17100 [Parasedimentitalea maritima]|uniref:Leucine-rich repeat domain-containing protein n=1 Tax=Parasedimentitalea maritima TaxID=2578117 RepID=A0ABY2URD2_9RHOB|nr:hypothetical protein [Zongyanglinia marina]TLP59319.1 hypothetical protein FEE96_17100 [Zongyanglinia marina]